MTEGQKGEDKLTPEKNNEILSEITDPRERDEKTKLLEVFAQLGEGLDKAQKAVELGKNALMGK
ncbi:hypothetical protein CO176_00365 [Candidatus Woesebacteria bacterium CG_4_9_14_3_um_filter_39_10]|uniref:Uncharacterized protein n=1 Tax=Candidatus Woesebacteria bacterium CG_4_9_14_3_um_filter_39_10 TaxID=1975056 RepID=A0A2M7XA86_9BACT|nr:MAG: hypothetical protein CO176_00365 [Candidatus Woesebacteria bacterium CG_4_9_14_3_um_filter_39_10]